MRKKYTFRAGQHTLLLGVHTSIMGIVNCTPDSFSQDGLFQKRKPIEASLRRIRKMIRDGADVLDIGGESSRPDSKRISAKEEIKRVIPAIDRIRTFAKIPLSIDTYKPLVAKHALDHGAVIVNNIMGAQLEPSLLKMIKNYDAGIILMHMKGIPRTMQKRIKYKNPVEEIISSLQISIEKCLEIGINSDRIVVDPGIGFGKTLEHNLGILKHLKSFKCFNKPILIGTSRKSFIGTLLDKKVNQRIYGSIASASIGITHGAHIVRVHDVMQTKQAAVITDAIINAD